MSRIILTEGYVELLPDASYLGSFAENVLTLLLQLSLRQLQISTGNDWHSQFLDGSLKRISAARWTCLPARRRSLASHMPVCLIGWS